MLFGRPTTDEPPPPAGVTVREVGPSDADAFGWTYEQVWGGAREITVLLGRPAYRCYLAEVDGQPAA